MKKYFITGLVILLPLAVTVAVVIFLVNFLTKPFMGLMMKLLSHTGIKDVSFLIFSKEQVLRYGSQIFILFGLFFLILAIGIVGRWFFVKAFFRLSDKVLHKIPLVNKVYKTTQDIIQTLFVTDKNSFKQVVMVPFPSKETYSLGLVSRDSPKTCQKHVEKKRSPSAASSRLWGRKLSWGSFQRYSLMKDAALASGVNRKSFFLRKKYS